jgi:formyl-CoA transferase
LSVPDILAHPQVGARDLLATFADVEGVGRDIDVVRMGALVDGERPRVSTPPPRLSADTDDILRGLGMDEVEVAALRTDGVV